MTTPQTAAGSLVSRRQTAHLSALVESSHDLIWSLDLDLCLVTFNRAFAEALGKEQGKLPVLGEPLLVLLPEELARSPHALFDHLAAEGSFRAEHSLADGRLFEIAFNPIHQDGILIGISCYGKDVTERKLLEELRNRSEARFRALVENAPTAVVLARNEHILYANQKFADLYKLASPQAAIGRLARSFAAPPSAVLIDHRIERAKSGILDSPSYQAIAQRSDGSTFPVHVAVAPIDLPDGPGIMAFITDLTQEERAHRALEESEARFRTIIECAPSAVAIGKDGLNHYVNSKFLEMFGYRSRDEVIGKPITQQFVPRMHDMILGRHYQRLAGESIPETYEAIAERSDGTQFPVHVAVTLVQLPEGPASLAFLTDMTDAKAAEQALANSEALFRGFFSLPLVGMAITTPRKGFVAVSDRLCDILGYGREELLQGDWARITHPDDLAIDVAQFRLLLAGKIDVYSIDKRFLRKDGTTIWASISVGCVRRPDGSVDHLCGVLEDISARKAAEQATQKAEREYRQIFEEAPEGIFRAEVDGTSFSVSPAGARIMGYASSEDAAKALGIAPQVVWLHPQDWDEYVADLERCGELPGREFPWKKKDGTVIWVSVTARCVPGPDGKTLHYQGFFEDISEKKQLEATLKERLREVQILSEISSALLHATSEEDLLREYCRIVVELGGYRMAWVGFAESLPLKRVVPVAWFGEEQGYLSAITVTWDGTLYSRGPTGRAILTGEICVAADYQNDPGLVPFREEAAKRGFASSIAVPFRTSPDSMACLTAYGKEPSTWSESERHLMDRVAAALGFGIQTLRTGISKERYERDLRDSLEQTIQMIVETVDQRDPYTAGHERRVASLAEQIGLSLGLDREQLNGLRLAACIHDVGKIGIPAEILTKPGRLTPNQFNLIKEHVQLGYDIIRNVKFPWPIADIVLQHHERLDGSGYPRGLKEDDILLEAKILAVADVVEAMGTHRPYRPARGLEVALDEILQNRGILYHPAAVDACIRLFRELGYTLPA